MKLKDFINVAWSVDNIKVVLEDSYREVIYYGLVYYISRYLNLDVYDIVKVTVVNDDFKVIVREIKENEIKEIN